jgi:manganese transport protein
VSRRRKGGAPGLLSFLGPAFVAAIAYVDPGNFATNIQGGARYGYELLWVVLAANLIAIVIQILSAKLGIATGRNLPELCREHLPASVTRGLWVQAELVAMATDLAELVGGALALNMLLGIPLLPAGALTGAGAFAILGLQNRGARRFEAAIAALLGVILIAFLYDTLRVGPDPQAVGHGFIPAFSGSGSVLLATGILGATVMPHVIYLHSALTQDRVEVRDDRDRRRLLRFERVDVALALGVAGIVNMAILVTGAALFHGHGLSGLDDLLVAHHEFARLAGGAAALVFALGLLAAGLASSSVGTFAGQVVMQGFVRRRIPLALRRLATIVPPLVVLGAGVDPTRALVLSQVALSFGIPFALIPLVVLSSRRSVMGALVNRRPTIVVASAIAGLVVALNIFLLVSSF